MDVSLGPRDFPRSQKVNLVGDRAIPLYKMKGLETQGVVTLGEPQICDLNKAGNKSP